MHAFMHGAGRPATSQAACRAEYQSSTLVLTMHEFSLDMNHCFSHFVARVEEESKEAEELKR